ncbi:type I 3-dehydroquinate dehydratase [Lentilactobacillus sp. SPB1-3]|uniref:Type I 3-dehydroquinate dehydratase n=1 Tax=Lentilactobacillus terminaliae TaxID=3003483 RepID=A0ACD5DFM1_9LACO|nr:type I 3-dehydroquinate dehydratase [Lentilactobacillus sp. SPB1-3]MCZ0976472.1 type I 3-dehydroquinate dehydratase [Lentilactobacillus sp. SPB1-3]
MTTKPIKIKNIILGEGRPKIAVPITGKTETDIINQAQTIVTKKPDMVEWRIDFFEEVTNASRLHDVGEKLAQYLNGIALLVTFRTQTEGGEMSLSDERYFDVCLELAKSRFADAVDVEMFHDPEPVMAVVEEVHQNNKVVVMSNHNFDQTPSEAEIITRLSEMQDLGADVLKMAVMPSNVDDVLTLLSATTHAQAALVQPIVTMAMGELGKLTRISGELFGSALSFATVDEASAPGQMKLERVKNALDDLKIE